MRTPSFLATNPRYTLPNWRAWPTWAVLLEGVALFGGVPVLLAYGRQPNELFQLAGLAITLKLLAQGAVVVVFAAVLVWLGRRGHLTDARLWRLGALRQALPGIAWRFIPMAVGLVGLMWLVMPQMLWGLPRMDANLWLKVMLLYPLVSVLPQELLFRVFVARRYPGLLRHPLLYIVASALAFGWAHLFYQNWPALVLPTVGGAFFAINFARHRSIWAVWLEHTLWGNLIFTIGLGAFFYDGPIDLQVVHHWRGVFRFALP